jgi:S-(hydroxymethyl)glutathione dehydrogenase / alcohol dehydrogenase
MKAAVFHKPKDIRVETVPDPRIEQDRDAIIKVTSTAICGMFNKKQDGCVKVVLHP